MTDTAVFSLTETFAQTAIWEARATALASGMTETVGLARTTGLLAKASVVGTVAYGGINAIDGISEGDAGKTVGAMTGTAAALASAQICAAGAGVATAATGVGAPAAPIVGAVAGVGCGIGGYFLGENVGHMIGDSLADAGYVPEEVSQEHVYEIVRTLPPLMRDPETNEFLDKSQQPYQFLMDGDMYELSDSFYDFYTTNMDLAKKQSELIDEMAEQDWLCNSIQRKIDIAREEMSPNLSVLHDQMIDARAALLERDDFANRFYNKFGQEHETLKSEAIQAEEAYGRAFEKYSLKIGGDYNAMKHTGSELDIFDYREKQSDFISHATGQAMEIYAEGRIAELKGEYGFPDQLNGQDFAFAIQDEHVLENYLETSGYDGDPAAIMATGQIAGLYEQYLKPEEQQLASTLDVGLGMKQTV